MSEVITDKILCETLLNKSGDDLPRNLINLVPDAYCDFTRPPVRIGRGHNILSIQYLQAGQYKLHYKKGKKNTSAVSDSTQVSAKILENLETYTTLIYYDKNFKCADPNFAYFIRF